MAKKVKEVKPAAKKVDNVKVDIDSLQPNAIIPKNKSTKPRVKKVKPTEPGVKGSGVPDPPPTYPILVSSYYDQRNRWVYLNQTTETDWVVTKPSMNKSTTRHTLESAQTFYDNWLKDSSPNGSGRNRRKNRKV
ncbi:MAG: hypothetical protein HXX16_17260 [Bacteroidales bacterium]|nr:hypothetical protein [Bacteroidales bacterium]